MRMALIYREGGWYSDWKQECLQEHLLDKLASNVTLYTIWDRGHAGVIKERCMQNSFFGATQGHPLIAIQIRIMMEHVQQNYYGRSPIHPTGPCAFGMAFKEFQKNFVWILSIFLKILEETTVEFSNNSETEFHQNSRELGTT